MRGITGWSPTTALLSNKRVAEGVACTFRNRLRGLYTAGKAEVRELLRPLPSPHSTRARHRAGSTKLAALPHPAHRHDIAGIMPDQPGDNRQRDRQQHPPGHVVEAEEGQLPDQRAIDPEQRPAGDKGNRRPGISADRQESAGSG